MTNKTKGERLFRIMKRVDTSRARVKRELEAASPSEIEYAIYAAQITGNTRIANILARELDARKKHD